jgi:hypothetical protein
VWYQLHTLVLKCNAGNIICRELSYLLTGGIWHSERERESERRILSQDIDCLGAEDKWMLNTVSRPVSSFNCTRLYFWVDGGPCEWGNKKTVPFTGWGTERELNLVLQYEAHSSCNRLTECCSHCRIWISARGGSVYQRNTNKLILYCSSFPHRLSFHWRFV